MGLIKKYITEYHRILEEYKDCLWRDIQPWFEDLYIFNLAFHYENEYDLFEENLHRLQKYVQIHQDLLDAAREILKEASEAGEASDGEEDYYYNSKGEKVARSEHSRISCSK